MPSIFQIPEAAFECFYDTPVAFHGTRPNARPVDITVDCCIIEESPGLSGEATAPTNARAFAISFPRSAWRDATPPQIGEWARFMWRGVEMWVKADAVTYMPDGDYSLTATWKPERRPSW